jgi:hypothetical protein
MLDPAYNRPPCVTFAATLREGHITFTRRAQSLGATTETTATEENPRH